MTLLTPRRHVLPAMNVKLNGRSLNHAAPITLKTEHRHGPAKPELGSPLRAFTMTISLTAHPLLASVLSLRPHSLLLLES